MWEGDKVPSPCLLTRELSHHKASRWLSPAGKAGPAAKGQVWALESHFAVRKLAVRVKMWESSSPREVPLQRGWDCPCSGPHGLERKGRVWKWLPGAAQVWAG